MNTYLEEISKSIKNKTAKKTVLAELESHIEEKKNYYIEIGYSEAEAEAKAVKEMGEAEEVAASMNTLHSEKWYKNIFNVISIIILLLCFIMSYIISDNCYYLESTVEIHHLWVDLLSLAVFTALVVIFALSMRYDNKVVPAVYLATVALLLLIISIAPSFLPVNIEEKWYDGFRPLTGLLTNYLKPLVYSCVVIFTKGYSEYTETLHGYDYADVFENGEYDWLVLVVWIILVLWAVFIILKVLCKERMYYVGIFKFILSVIKNTVTAFCGFLIIAAIVASSYTYIMKNSIIEETENYRREIIEFIVNADTKKDCKELADDFSKRFPEVKHKFIKPDFGADTYFFQKYNNQLKINISSSVAVSSYPSEYYSDLSYSYFPYTEYYKIDTVTDKTRLKALKYGMSIHKFMNSGLCSDVLLAEKYGVIKTGESEHLGIAFYFDTDKELTKISFLDGKLSYNEAISKNVYFDLEKNSEDLNIDYSQSLKY